MTFNKAQFIEEKKEKFKKEVSKIGEQGFLYGGETGVSDFGYKVKRDDEIFTVTDFGNIEKFLEQSLNEAITKTTDDIMEFSKERMIEKYSGDTVTGNIDWYVNYDDLALKIHELLK